MPFLLNNFKLLFEEIQEEDAENMRSSRERDLLLYTERAFETNMQLENHRRANTASHGTMATTTPELEENRRAFTRLDGISRFTCSNKANDNVGYATEDVQ